MRKNPTIQMWKRKIITLLASLWLSSSGLLSFPNQDNADLRVIKENGSVSYVSPADPSIAGLRHVYIYGHVLGPGVYLFKGELRLIDLLKLARVVSDDPALPADLGHVCIVNTDMESRVTKSLTYDVVRLWGDDEAASKSPILHGGELIHVPFTMKGPKEESKPGKQ